jgi:uncharacterized membrane protein
MMGFFCHGLGLGMRWGHWGGGMLGWIVPLLFWGVLLLGLVIAIYWLARYLRRASPSTASAQTPLDAARQRLALGEITVEQFDEIRERLER